MLIVVYSVRSLYEQLLVFLVCVFAPECDLLFMLGLGFLSAYCTGPFPLSGWAPSSFCSTSCHAAHTHSFGNSHLAYITALEEHLISQRLLRAQQVSSHEHAGLPGHSTGLPNLFPQQSLKGMRLSEKWSTSGWSADRCRVIYPEVDYNPKTILFFFFFK